MKTKTIDMTKRSIEYLEKEEIKKQKLKKIIVWIISFLFGSAIIVTLKKLFLL